MMSRITLSLRKKAHAHEADSLLRSDVAWKSAASTLPRFAIRSCAAVPTPTELENVSDMGQESAIVHNEDTSNNFISAERYSKDAHEWHELQVRPS